METDGNSLVDGRNHSVACVIGAPFVRQTNAADIRRRIRLILRMLLWIYLILSVFGESGQSGTGGGLMQTTALVALAMPLVLWYHATTNFSMIARFSSPSFWLAAIAIALVVPLIIKGQFAFAARAASWLAAATFICTALQNDKEFRYLMIAIVCLAVVVSIAVVARFGLTIPEWPDIFRFASRNTLAYFLALGLGASFALFTSRKMVVVNVLLSGIFVLLILLSGSRGASVVAIIGFAIYAVDRRAMASSSQRRLLIFLFGSLVLFIAFNETVRDRLMSSFSMDMAGNSNYYRYALYVAAFQTLPHIALLGGTGGQEALVMFNATGGQFLNLASNQFTFDSDYITMALLGGAGPVIMLFSFSVSLLARIWQLKKSRVMVERQVFSIFVVLLVIANTTVNDTMTSQYGWFLAAIAVMGSRPNQAVDNVLKVRVYP